MLNKKKNHEPSNLSGFLYRKGLIHIHHTCSTLVRGLAADGTVGTPGNKHFTSRMASIIVAEEEKSMEN